MITSKVQSRPAGDPGGHRPAHRRPRRRWVKWLLRLIALLVLVGLLAVGALLALVETSPSVSNAPQRVAGILRAHGAPSDGGAIPARVADALLATEDSRYYDDPALDPQGVGRAALGVLTANGSDGGATIELQLAKMLYEPSTSLTSELRQVGIAFRLDQRYTKHEILAMYLDAAYFGDGAYGITAAARHYFGVSPDQLSWAQASLLAGLVQAPSEYDPHGHLTLARSRQSHVLSRLVATHQITPAQRAQIWAEPLDPVVAFYG